MHVCTDFSGTMGNVLTTNSETSICASEQRACKVTHSQKIKAPLLMDSRVNSTQSIRIRNLECEVSRLLSENASFREEIIRLHYELERNTGSTTTSSVDAVKNQLEDKLSELGNLVRELGDLQRDRIHQSSQRTLSIIQGSPKRSPDQKRWRNGLTISEVLGSEEGRLPPILEDKHYPRRTLRYDV